MRKTAKGVVALAVLALGGSAVALQPAAAQSGYRDYDDSYRRSERGYYDRNQGWAYRGNQDAIRDRYGREEYRRGYDAGRDEERRSGRSGNRDYSEAMDLLERAQQQMDEGNLRAAWVTLGQAETRLATRSVRGAEDGGAAGGAVGAIRDARDALRERDVDRAESRVDRAVNLVQRGSVVERNTQGSRLEGAGEPGRSQPFMGGGRGYRDQYDD